LCYLDVIELISLCRGFRRSQDEQTRYCWQEETHITLTQKLDIIRRLESSKSQNMFRASNNGLSTVYVIKKQKSQL